MNAKNFLTKTFLFVALIALATFTSCKVGLGAAVDTLPPSVSISTPSVNAIKSNEFEITGFASDDRGLKNVIVNLVDNGVTKYVYLATIDETTTQWKVTVPTLNPDKTTAVEDGKYEILVVATDKDGKSSVATRAVQIDNTAPTVLLTSPSLFDENKSTFFRQLRISGSCYDVSEIKSVKVYFYKDGETSTDLNDTSKYKVFQAEGTNTWELSKDIDANDTFFANNTVYNFFVVAEDVARNKNTYFYRYGDFYSKKVLVDTNTNDNDNYIPFPSMLQIGKFDQGETVENPTSGLTKENLYKIRTQCKSIKENNSNFLYRSQAASSISWGNIEYDKVDNSSKSIPLGMAITGQIKSTDGSDLKKDTVKFYLAKYIKNGTEEKLSDWWLLDDKKVTLDPSGQTIGFTLDLEDCVSGNYCIKIEYQTIASQNSTPLESLPQNFGITAGMPKLTETKLLSPDGENEGASPISAQVYTGAESVILGGIAKNGNGNKIGTGENDTFTIIKDGVELKNYTIDEDGNWELTFEDEGTHTFEITADDGGSTVSLNRTVIIDRTPPSITDLGFTQDSTKKNVTITGFVTDDNLLGKIQYAFVHGNTAKAEEISNWTDIGNKSVVKIEIHNEKGFEQGPWTLFVKATDKAGNQIVTRYEEALDLDKPKFETFTSTTIPELGFLNENFEYLVASLSDETVLASDNYKLKQIQIITKKDSEIVYEYTKELDSEKLTKANLSDFATVIEKKTENEGKWIITITLLDSNGNKTEKTLSFTMDSTPPTVEIETVPLKESNSSKLFEFKGNAEDAVSSVEKIYLSLDNENWKEVEGSKVWFCELEIQKEGEGVLYAKAVDGAGNESIPISKDFTFDSGKPELTITTEAGTPTWARNSKFALQGTAIDGWGIDGNVTVFQDDVEITDDIDFENGTWTVKNLPRGENLKDKEYVYKISAKDKAGKTSEITQTIKYDTTAPVIDVINLKDGDGFTTKLITVKGTTEDSSRITGVYYWFSESEPTNENWDGWKPVSGNFTSWTIGLENLDDKNYTLYIAAEDELGNKSKPVKMSFAVDAKSPTVTLNTNIKTDSTNYTKSTFKVSGDAKDSVGLAKIEIKNGSDILHYINVEDKKETTWEWEIPEEKLTKDNVTNIIVTVTDKAGHQTNSSSFNVYRDTKAPEIVLKNLDDDGLVITENDIKDGKFTVTGSWNDNGGSGIIGGEANLTYSFYDSSYISFKNKANNWENDIVLPVSNLDGKTSVVESLEQFIYFKSIDAIGNVLDPVRKVKVTIDTSAPTAGTTSSDDAVLKADDSYILQGTATDTLGLEKVVVTATKNGVEAWTEEFIPNGDEKSKDWKIPIPASQDTEGNWIFTIKAYDKAGRVSETETRTLLVDVGGPVFATDDNKPRITSDSVTVGSVVWYKNQTIKMEGQLIEGNGIESIKYSLDNNEWLPCDYSKNENTYTFSAVIPVEEQWTDKTIYLMAKDSVGNETPASIAGIYVDRNNPTIEVKSDFSNLLLNGKNDLDIKVDVNDDGTDVKSIKAKVGVLNFSSPDKTVEVSSSGEYSFTISKEAIAGVTGTSGTIYLRVEDKSGKTADTSFTFKKDSEAPTVEITSHSNESTVNKTITLKGSTTEAQGLSKVEIFANGSSIKTFTGNDGFNWSWDINTEDYDNEAGTGTLLIKVVATDNAGNESEPKEISLNIDQKADRPLISLGNVTNGGYLTGQKYIWGTISDDDGNINLLEVSLDSGSTWTEVPTPNNGFTYNFDPSVKDGIKNIWFKITDKVNGKFTTKTSGSENDLDIPVLEHTEEENKTVKSYVPLTFNLDTKVPELKDDNTKLVFTDGTDKKFSEIKEVGGNKKEFTLQVDVSDGNGIKEVSLKYDGKELTGDYNGTDSQKNGIWEIPVNTDNINGNLDFEITVVDNAESSITRTRTVLVDNTKPTISIDSHNQNDQVTGTVRISGTTTDGDIGSGVASVKWLIAKKSDEAGKSDEDIIALDGWKDVNGTGSWNYTFSGDGELGNYVKLGTNQNKDVSEVQYGTHIENGIYSLPIYILITDKVGNQHLEKFVLNVDPEGDRPKAEVVYPTDLAKLGGAIRVFGTAEDNETVAVVHMQIDTDGDGDFDAADKDFLAKQDKDGKKLYTIVDIEESEDVKDWAVKVNGTTSWNITINSNGEFNPSDNDPNKISFRVRAGDKSNEEGKEYDLLGIWTDPVNITIDANAPRIGSYMPPKLVQYGEDGVTEIASVTYTPDMWIKGDWYLVTSVQDENGIKDYNITDSNFSDIKIESAESLPDGTDEGYIIKIPINTTENRSGDVISFKIYTMDNQEEGTELTSEFPVSIKFDNTPPNIADKPLMHGASNIAESKITQSNNAFEFQSAVSENGSGFKRLAIYFKRTGNDGTRIYNPVIPFIREDENGNRTNITENGVKIIDELPRLAVTGATRGSEETIAHNLLKDNPNIRVGGLVRIAGVERLITNVNSSSGTVTFTPAVDPKYTDAEFAYALVVDNFRIENTTKYDDYGNPIHISNDDNDMVVESVEKTGTTYDWTLAINSKNIPDGPITICYVAYDEAGNCSPLKEIETSVENNPPMIAKVWLGTDLNGDGKISRIDEDNSEEVEYRTNSEKSDNVDLNAYDSDEKKFTAKDNTTIRPEIVGGNGNLYYKVGDKLEILRGTDKNGKTGDGTILLEVKDEKLAGVLDGKGEFIRKIWDSTEELIPGEDSQTATIKVTMNIDVVDDNKPTVEIKPLYWNSKSDNSLYANSPANGHIDLSADLPSESFNGTAENDKDDKVSGKITFTGTAYDDVRLSSISFSFDKFTGTATYSGNTWTNPTSKMEVGYEFTVEEVSLDQDGHKVNWTLSIDTEKIDGVAKADVKLNVTAVDHTKKGTNTASAEKKVDVVPYITGVKTWLYSKKKLNQTVYSRTAQGHYPVASTETITLIGFNLSATSNEMTLDASTLSSGKYAVTVNNISSLNNINKNSAKGGSVSSELEDQYNMQANGETNNTLTDDIIFDVWEINTKAAQAKSGKIREPVMRINPNNNMIGFAFANGSDSFNMPNGTNASTTVWQKNFANYSGINFEYGSDGRVHSLSTGLDTEPKSGYGGRLQYINSAWGGNGDDNMYNWNTDVTVSLDCVGVPNGTYLEGVRQGANLIDIERFSSPSIAVAGTDRVYIAYFDRFNKQIRFVYGTSDTTNNGGKRVGGLLNSRTASNGSIRNDTNADASNYGYHSIYESSNESYSVVAGVEYNNNGGGKADTGNVAGEHLSIAVIPGTDQTGDVVVFVWYDGNNLKYTFRYGTKDDIDANSNGVANKWSKSQDVFQDTGIGEHCAVTVDADGGIHIAAYDKLGADLHYAYIAKTGTTQVPDSWASPKTCVVDSYSQIGKYISIDVAKKSAQGKVIPYISYFAEGFSGLPKVAYLPEGIDASSELNDGTDIDTDLFTGDWEVSLIPSSSYICEDNMNVAVWKNNGVITTSTKPNNTGNNVYGNGTSQFVLGYATEEGVNGYIETAQLK